MLANAQVGGHFGFFAQAYKSGDTATIDTLFAPANFAAAAEDSAITFSWDSVANATSYFILTATDTGFTRNVISLSAAASPSVLINVPNDSTRYCKIKASAGPVSSIYTLLSGTVTPHYFDRLAAPGDLTGKYNPVGINNAITIRIPPVAGRQYFNVLISTDQYFPDSTVRIVHVVADSVTVPLTNDSAYYLAIESYSNVRRHSWRRYANGYIIPHIQSGTILDTPGIADQIIMSPTSLKVLIDRMDIRDSSYTVEISKDAFATIAKSVTGVADSLLLTGLDSNTFYHLRVKSNRIGYTSSPFRIYNTYVITGSRHGAITLTALGDSNTEGFNYPTGSDPRYSWFWTMVRSNDLDTSLVTKRYNDGAGGSFSFSRPWPLIGYDTTTSANLVVNAYGGTNDMTIYFPTISTSDFIDSTLNFVSRRNAVGFKHCAMMAPIPYAGRDFNSGKTWPPLDAWMQINQKKVLGYFSYYDLYQNDTFHKSPIAPNPTSPYLPFWAGDELHYKTPQGHDVIHGYMLPIVQKLVDRTFIRPPALVSISWNAGAQDMTIVLPSGLLLPEAEYTLNYDGIAGMQSIWIPLTSATIHVTSTQAAKTFAVRVKANRNTSPSIALFNASQLN